MPSVYAPGHALLEVLAAVSRIQEAPVPKGVRRLVERDEAGGWLHLWHVRVGVDGASGDMGR